MGYFVHVFDDGGFEIIHGDFLDFYTNINQGGLTEITDNQYLEFIQKGDKKTKFIKGKFVFNKSIVSEKDKAKIKQREQNLTWERIKQKRYENSLGGVYIERIGKWFQTGEEEKTKYLGLDKVINKLGEIDWKCADNTFVKLDRTLLDEIFLQMVVAENADHINAEKHRIAMMAVENPLEYDYSTGWTKTYKDFIKEQTNGN